MDRLRRLVRFPHRGSPNRASHQERMLPVLTSEDLCPCGDASFGQCCQPALEGRVWPETAEALMRSRFTAFALGIEDHIFRTWHPKTRPADVSTDPVIAWQSLEIHATNQGGVEDATGTVDFSAHYTHNGVAGVQHELSEFSRRAGRWVYLGAQRVE